MHVCVAGLEIKNLRKPDTLPSLGKVQELYVFEQISKMFCFSIGK